MKKPIAILAALLCVPGDRLGSAFISARAGRAALLRQVQPHPRRYSVMADLARDSDVPIYLSGLGTVQAFNSVLGQEPGRRPDAQDPISRRAKRFGRAT